MKKLKNGLCIQKNDDLNRRFTEINMQSFFLKIRLFIFYCFLL